MKVIKVTPRGYCKGVTRAIALARKTAMEYPVARKVTSIGYNNGVAGILSSGRIYTYSDLGEETGAYDAGNDAKKILLYSNSQAYVLGVSEIRQVFFS